VTAASPDRSPSRPATPSGPSRLAGSAGPATTSGRAKPWGLRRFAGSSGPSGFAASAGPATTSGSRRRRRAVALIVLAAALAPVVSVASPAQAQVDPQPDYVRMHPDSETLVFMRANDLVTYHACDSQSVHCVPVTSTCGRVSEDMRKQVEAAEQARRTLTAAEVYRIADPALGGVPRADVRLQHYLEQLKDEGVLPLRYALINSEIDPEDPSTYRDPQVDRLLEALYESSGDVEESIKLVQALDDLTASPLNPSDPSLAGMTIATLLPDSARERASELATRPAGTLDPGELATFMGDVREALRVDLSPAVVSSLEGLHSRLMPQTSNTGLDSFNRSMPADEVPYWLVDPLGRIEGFLELLGLEPPSMDSVDSVEVVDGSGTPLIEVSDYALVYHLDFSCRVSYLRGDLSLAFADSGGGSYVTVERALGSIAPVAGRSAEAPGAGALHSVAVHDAGGNLLYQDDSYDWYRILPQPTQGAGRRQVEVGSSGSYRLVLVTSLRLERDGAVWRVLDWIGSDGDGLPEPEPVATHPASEVESAVPASVRQHARSGVASSIIGGAIAVEARYRLGEAVINYCLRAERARFCPNLGRLTVLVEPEGWDDARAVGVDDAFRVVVDRVEGRISLLQERPDGEQPAPGDVELDGRSHVVLERLCCLDRENRDFWSVELVLPVMRNDRVRFLRAGMPLDKDGNTVPVERLDSGDTVSCSVVRYCGYVRPRALGVPSRLAGGLDLDVGVSSYRRSLELRLSTDPTSEASAGSARFRFRYCLAHREGDCSASPPQCTRVTYIEPPRAPNAGVAPILGAASLSDVPVSFFEVRDGEGCEQTVATVTVRVDVYGESSPPDSLPAEVWDDSEPPAPPPPPPEEKQCYVPPRTSLSHERFTEAVEWSDQRRWSLAPDTDEGRKPPPWCFLPDRTQLAKGGYCIEPDSDPVRQDWVLQHTQPSYGSRWRAGADGSPPHRAGQSPSARPDDVTEELFLVGQGLTEGPDAICQGARPRIVGVWGTHVGAPNWRFGERDSPDADCLPYPEPREHSCDYGRDPEGGSGFLDQASNHVPGLGIDPSGPSLSHHSLGAAWHTSLAAVEPCVGESECDVWAPPVPGWYQVRIEVDAPEVHRRHHRSHDHSIPPIDGQDYCPEGDAGTKGTYINPRTRMPGDSDVWYYCYTQLPDTDGDGPEEAPEPVPVPAQGNPFVFDELIWVEAPYLVL